MWQGLLESAPHRVTPRRAVENYRAHPPVLLDRDRKLRRRLNNPDVDRAGSYPGEERVVVWQEVLLLIAHHMLVVLPAGSQIPASVRDLRSTHTSEPHQTQKDR